MSESIPKYRIVKASGADEFMEKVNTLVGLGYKVHTFEPCPLEWVAYMSHSDTAFLGNAMDFVNVEFDKNREDGTPLLAKMIRDGWRSIAVYSKHVTLMKVNEDAGMTPMEVDEYYGG